MDKNMKKNKILAVQPWECKQTNRQTDRRADIRTDATKCIISLASRSINILKMIPRYTTFNEMLIDSILLCIRLHRLIDPDQSRYIIHCLSVTIQFVFKDDSGQHWVGQLHPMPFVVCVLKGSQSINKLYWSTCKLQYGLFLTPIISTINYK